MANTSTYMQYKAKVKKWPWSLAILLALISPGGLPAQQQGAHQHSDNSVVGKDDWPGLMASMEKMHIDMESIDPSGDSDVDFVRLMPRNIQRESIMAKPELMNAKNRKSPNWRKRIIPTSKREIK